MLASRNSYLKSEMAVLYIPCLKWKEHEETAPLYVEEAPNEQKNKWVLHSICGSESFVSDKSTESFAGNFSAIDHESAKRHVYGFL